MATNTCLSCDSVFDILTRGPYPNSSGQSDADVDQHLAACHDCRQLAEALRPATHLFHEVIASESAVGLPVFETELPDLKSMTTIVAAEKPKLVWRSIAVATCLVLIGCAAGFGLRDVTTAPTPDITMASGGTTTAVMTVHDLTALPIDDSCQRNVIFTQHSTEETEKNTFDCCTRCHHSKGHSATTDRTTIIASSCLVCHSTPRS